jgi:ankyrin repeat protein
MTALHWAVEFNRLEMVELLVDQGANVNTKTYVSEPGMNNGETPLQLAIRLGHKEIADYLRKHGAVE